MTERGGAGGDGGGDGGGPPGGAEAGGGPPAGGRGVRPSGRRPRRISARGTGAWGGRGHSSRAGGRSGRENSRGFRLGAGPRRVWRRRGVDAWWTEARRP